MRVLGVFDSNNYKDIDDISKRTAARAIIFKDNMLFLVYGSNTKDFKFPGGGVDEGETLIETLIREVREEVGLIVKEDTIKKYGYFIEKRKSIKKDENFIYYLESHYFLCEVEEKSVPITPTLSEIKAGYDVKLVNIDDAILANSKVPFIWSKRETYVMKLLKEEFKNILT